MIRYPLARISDSNVVGGVLTPLVSWLCLRIHGAVGACVSPDGWEMIAVICPA